MRVATFNVNGIRAASRRGFTDWLTQRNCEVVGLQEVRCKVADLPDAFADYAIAYHPGNIPGRNGVALLVSKDLAANLPRATQMPEVSLLNPNPSLEARIGFGHTSDPDGRYIELDLPGVTVGCLYLPKGDVSDGDAAALARYQYKMSFLESFTAYLPQAIKAAQKRGNEFLVMGDYNIARENIDLKNWRNNQKSSGFLPEERRWFAELIGVSDPAVNNPVVIADLPAPATNLVDVSRQANQSTPGPYTWWSWRGNAFTNDTGWRIDYQLATPSLAAKATRITVDRASDYDSRVSDHAALVADYAI